jgi:hypothetical protein
MPFIPQYFYLFFQTHICQCVFDRRVLNRIVSINFSNAAVDLARVKLVLFQQHNNLKNERKFYFISKKFSEKSCLEIYHFL